MNEYEKPGFYNADCMDAMRQFPDGFCDLAIVDPPYGDGGQNIGGASLRRIVRPVQDGTASGRDSTGTSTKIRRGGYHGKWPDATEPGELGRRNSAKKS